MRGMNYMIKKILPQLKSSLLFCFAFTILFCDNSYGQVSGTQQQEIKWLTVNELHQWFSSGGAEIEYGRRGRSGFESVDQLDGLNWPAVYTINKGVHVGKSLWIGTTNFQDPSNGVLYPYKVVCSGRLNMYLGTEIIQEELKLVGKYAHPTVLVDDINASSRDFDDVVDEIDPNLPSDRMIVNKFHTSIGISCTRKVYAFAQQNHDNYYIYEYVFKNTGIIDETFQPTITRNLTGVRFHWQNRYGFAGESYLPNNAWSPTGAAWGLNTLNDAIGMDAAHPGDFRAVWSYYGPHSIGPGYDEDIGLPRHVDGSIMAGTNYAGVVCLHADKSASDHSDDPAQPSTSAFQPSDRGAQGVDQYDPNLMTRKYVEFMSAGHLAQTHAEQAGRTFANTWGGDAGGYAATMGFGPYEMAPGDSIRIVFAEGVAGLMSDRDLVREIAGKWFNNQGPFVLPDGSTTTDRNEYKNTWVLSGEDSLFNTFRRAIDAYNNGMTIPQPPPPPESFTISSGGDMISLSWANNAETHPNFDGYQIFRAEGRADTTYNMIFSCNGSNVVNNFDDVTARRGFNYYYYIVSKDNGSTNDVNPGVPLVSSRYMTMTNAEAFLRRPPGRAISESVGIYTFTGDGVTTDFTLPFQIELTNGIIVKVDGNLQLAKATYTIENNILHFYNPPVGNIEVALTNYPGGRIFDLSAIRIVPNPYHIGATTTQFGNDSPDRLAFYNLPPFCTIKIFTENGDLIETIDHSNGVGDELWHSLTSSRQIVASGLYIAHFEVSQDAFDDSGNLLYKKGDSVIKKFIVIR